MGVEVGCSDWWMALRRVNEDSQLMEANRKSHLFNLKAFLGGPPSDNYIHLCSPICILVYSSKYTLLPSPFPFAMFWFCKNWPTLTGDMCHPCLQVRHWHPCWTTDDNEQQHKPTNASSDSGCPVFGVQPDRHSKHFCRWHIWRGKVYSGFHLLCLLHQHSPSPPLTGQLLSIDQDIMIRVTLMSTWTWTMQLFS